MDEVNCMLLLDNKLSNDMRYLDPHMSVLNLDKPRAISANLSMPKPVVSSISGYISVEETPDPYKLEKMQELCIS